jgi:V/A-type H+/Na+-transporting ATPase subunit G/H
MEDVISRLLEAEVKAEAIVSEANRQRDVLINEAREKAQMMEKQFETNRDQLRAPYLKEAESRAAEAIAELTRKYLERQRNLRDLATQHEQEAVAAAVALLLDPRL